MEDFTMLMAKTLEGLRELPDAELIHQHDEVAKTTVIGTQYFVDELVRREQDRATQAMLQSTQEMHKFTKQMRTMTIIILLATLASVAVSLLAFFKN
jgi:hypothetical protein